MISSINNNIQSNSKQVSFTSVPIFKLNVPKLVNKSYELTPAVFSMLDILDPQDIQMMHKFEDKFTYKINGVGITDMFFQSYTKKNSFYALEAPSAKNNDNELLGLLAATHESLVKWRKGIFVYMVNARSDIQKNKILNLFNREYKNVGELLLYGIGKIADSQDFGFTLISSNHLFYNKIKMPDYASTNRHFEGQALKDFLRTVENKFRLSNPSVNTTFQSS